MASFKYFDGNKWLDIGGGGSGTSDYSSLTNKPQINSIALTGNKTAAQLSLAAASHVHAESEITNLVSDLAGKAASSHTHTESNITGLVSDLAGKINEPSSEGTNGQVLTTNGSGGRTWQSITGPWAQLASYPTSGGPAAGAMLYIGTAEPSAAIAAAIGAGNLYLQVQS